MKGIAKIFGAAALVSALAPQARALELGIPAELGRGIDVKAVLQQNRDMSKDLSASRGGPVATAPAATGQGVLITLKNGNTIEGLWVSETDKAVAVSIGSGKVWVEKSEIASLEFVNNALQQFQEKLAQTDLKDAKALWLLSLWARTRNIEACSRKAAALVIAVDPDHAPARQYLGYELIDGKWLTRDQAMMSRGYVKHNGEWITKSELDQKLQEQAERARRAQEVRLRQEEQRQRLEEERYRAQLRVWEEQQKARIPGRNYNQYYRPGYYWHNGSWHHRHHGGIIVIPRTVRPCR